MKGVLNITMQSEVMVPVVKGTLNILAVCSSLKVQKVVVDWWCHPLLLFIIKWPQGEPKGESCWSDRKVCKDNEVSNIRIRTVS
jgi:hypothetical protein